MLPGGGVFDWISLSPVLSFSFNPDPLISLKRIAESFLLPLSTERCDREKGLVPSGMLAWNAISRLVSAAWLLFSPLSFELSPPPPTPPFSSAPAPC